jgi:hypothetical protein
MKPESPRNYQSLIEERKDFTAIYKNVREDLDRVEKKTKNFLRLPQPADL